MGFLGSYRFYKKRVSEIAKDLEDRFSIQLIISKLEDDGGSISTFRLLDYEEIIPFFLLEKLLTKFYDIGIKKIKEIAEELKKINSIPE